MAAAMRQEHACTGRRGTDRVYLFDDINLLEAAKADPQGFVAELQVGGYPPAVDRKTESRRAARYRDYVETQIRKDVRDLASISSFEVLPRLRSYVASQTAHLLNVLELAGPFQVTRQTIRD